MELSTYKQKLYDGCLKAVSGQLNAARTELKRLQEMEGEETKSSAGDKYETGRAMLFLEKEKVSIRLSEAFKKQKVLGQIKPQKTLEVVQMGSLIKTDKGYFFLAVSLGKENIDGVDFFVISPVSPIGKALTGKKKGGKASFNGVTYQILDLV